MIYGVSINRTCWTSTFRGMQLFLTDSHLDNLALGDTEDRLLMAGLGLNLYFGGNRKKEELRKK